MNDKTPAINFYHLTTSPLETALPKLLERALAGGYRALVVAENEERMEQLNALLWTYAPDSFLPHGSHKDGQAKSQPILLSNTIEPTNNANILIVTDGRNLPEGLGQEKKYEKVLDIFDGRDEQRLAAARTRWKLYKDAGYEISYFQQTENGGWQKKA